MPGFARVVTLLSICSVKAVSCLVEDLQSACPAGADPVWSKQLEATALKAVMGETDKHPKNNINTKRIMPRICGDFYFIHFKNRKLFFYL
jgi:hypothetical protein